MNQTCPSCGNVVKMGSAQPSAAVCGACGLVLQPQIPGPDLPAMGDLATSTDARTLKIRDELHAFHAGKRKHADGFEVTEFPGGWQVEIPVRSYWGCVAAGIICLGTAGMTANAIGRWWEAGEINAAKLPLLLFLLALVAFTAACLLYAIYGRRRMTVANGKLDLACGAWKLWRRKTIRLSDIREIRVAKLTYDEGGERDYLAIDLASAEAKPVRIGCYDGGLPNPHRLKRLLRILTQQTTDSDGQMRTRR